MKTKTKDTIAGYLFTAPVTIGMAIFTVVPILYSLYVSFCDFDNITPAKFVGLGNYEKMIADPLFYKSIQTTIIYALVSVVSGLVLSFFLALLLSGRQKGIKVFRTIFYTPVIVPAIAGSLVFADMFNVQYGFINTLLGKLGLGEFPFLSSPKTALFSIILYGLWGIGAPMLIWLAGFNSISKTYYEAADIDGANGLTKLIKITLPMSTPMIFYNLIMSIICNLQVFTQVYAMTNGGPDESTVTMVLNIYHYAFRYYEAGYASAMAWVLFMMILLLTVLVFKTSGWVFYGEEGA